MGDGPPRLPMDPSDCGTEVTRPIRSRAPSGADFVEAWTGSHTVDSDPPGVRRIDRMIGRGVRLGLRWLWRTKTGTLAFGGATGAVVHVLHRLHWLDWLWGR